MEIQLWRSILCPYELAVKELMVKFEHIIEEHKQNDLYSPIEQVSGRVKSLPSILEKMQRKHIPMEHMEEEIEDIKSRKEERSRLIQTLSLLAGVFCIVLFL